MRASTRRPETATVAVEDGGAGSVVQVGAPGWRRARLSALVDVPVRMATAPEAVTAVEIERSLRRYGRGEGPRRLLGRAAGDCIAGPAVGGEPQERDEPGAGGEQAQDLNLPTDEGGRGRHGDGLDRGTAQLHDPDGTGPAAGEAEIGAGARDGDGRQSLHAAGPSGRRGGRRVEIGGPAPAAAGRGSAQQSLPVVDEAAALPPTLVASASGRSARPAVRRSA